MIDCIYNYSISYLLGTLFTFIVNIKTFIDNQKRASIAIENLQPQFVSGLNVIGKHLDGVILPLVSRRLG